MILQVAANIDLSSILDVASTVGGIGGFLAAVWFIINWKSKRKTEVAAANLAEAEADGRVGDNWEKFSNKLAEEIHRQDEKIAALEERIEADKQEREQMKEDFEVREKAYQDKINELQDLVDKYKAINESFARQIEEMKRIIDKGDKPKVAKPKTTRSKAKIADEA